MKESIFGERLNAIVAYKFLHNLAVGLISVFIPIYFAQAGLPIYEVFGIALVQALAFAFIAVPVGITVARIGVNRSFIASSLIYVLLFVSIQVFETSSLLAALAGVLSGFGLAFHWIPLNSEFTHSSESDTRGEDLGKLSGIPTLISPLAPMAGALVITNLGFLPLVFVALMVVGLSAVPLLANGRVERPEIDLSSSLNSEDRLLWVLYMVDGFASLPYIFIFPLFVYFVIGGTVDTGVAKTFTGLGSGLLALAFGYITTRVGRKEVLVFGITLSAGLSLALPSIQSSFNAFLASFFLGVGYNAYTIPLVSMISDIGEEKEVLAFFSVREVFQNLGRILVVSILVASLYLYPQELAFRIIFYTGAASLLLLGWLAIWIGNRRQVIS